MNKKKRQTLEAAGFVVGNSGDFLGTHFEERGLVELRVAVSRAIRARREQQSLTQAQVAKRMGTSDPVAEVETRTRCFAGSDVPQSLCSGRGNGGPQSDLLSSEKSFSQALRSVTNGCSPNQRKPDGRGKESGERAMSKTGGYTGPLEQVGPCQWRIPKSYRADMRVDGLIFADETLIEQIKKDQGPEQVANVATLPGIQKASLAMPDIHWGYGFCIGGVAATDPEEGGVISPGGVGYDINCGVRLLRSEPRVGRRQDRITTAGRSALPRHSHRRRPAGTFRVRQAGAASR